MDDPPTEDPRRNPQAVEYTSQFENPVIVLEHLDGITDEDIGKHWNRRLGKVMGSRTGTVIAHEGDVSSA